METNYIHFVVCVYVCVVFCWFLIFIGAQLLHNVLVFTVQQSNSALFFSQYVMLALSSPWTAACQASLFYTISWNLLKLISMEPVMASNHLILCCPLLLLPSIFLSIRLFSSELALHIRSFSTSPASEYVGLISFWIDWFDLLADQGTRKNLQHHSSKYQFFSAQPSL